jgi:L-alanine-DL-glutamate epimerase-like enolase superfamily enzyme
MRIVDVRERSVAISRYRDASIPSGGLTWRAMMAGEKPGGHGERCVAVGTLDMAVWDAGAKIARAPLHRFLADVAGERGAETDDAPVYAGGGYYPADDAARLADEIRCFLDQGSAGPRSTGTCAASRR